MKTIIKNMTKTADTFSLWLSELIIVGLIIFCFWWFLMQGAESL